MSGTTTDNKTSVPSPRWTTQGFLLPLEVDLLKGLLSDYNACFGGNLNPSVETPQGQLMSTQAAIIADKNDQFLFLTQNIDPAFSSGRMQDGIARIYFLTRRPAIATVVTATCSGVPGTLLKAGSAALAADGNLYKTTSAVTLGPDGTAQATFVCAVTGKIACPAGALSQIYQMVTGWDSVFNDTDGVPGQDAENRAVFEQRRYASVAGNSAGMLASVRGAVLSVDGVDDCYVTENVSSSSVVASDGVTLAAHSLYVCVHGSYDDNDVANAIFIRKAPGCDTSGNIPITVYDTNAGYTPPYPHYTINFQQAAEQEFVFAVTIVNSLAVPSNALLQVQAAIQWAFAGNDGLGKVTIGSIVYASRYYAAVAQLGAWVQLVSIKIGSDAAAAANAVFTGSITGKVLTVTAMTSGAIGVGQTIMGTGYDGLRIVTFGTGIGAAGTYNLNVAPPGNTVASGPMSSVLPTLDDITVGIAHMPVVGADNIYLNILTNPP